MIYVICISKTNYSCKRNVHVQHLYQFRFHTYISNIITQIPTSYQHDAKCTTFAVYLCLKDSIKLICNLWKCPIEHYQS